MVHANRCEVLEHHSPHQEDSSSANHNSASGSVLVIGVDQQGKYIRLTNTSNEEQHLGGWRLEMQVNRRNISFTFEKSFSVKSGDTATMSGPGCMSRHSFSDLWWKDFKPFSPADKLKFTLINNTGEIRHELSSLTE
ncbi:prelamin-A/C-like isoform X2 [Anarrhichthys ocellatus]|uniref:prelamin-A/C-like isoform X2 n=1 Tax=Anarrhichthys ocellatus TaxID=433405 RepID=UPI0012EE6A5B|nr:prelamin-A/C-like isoform X2 [Anarrhichthys ocellatus]